MVLCSKCIQKILGNYIIRKKWSQHQNKATNDNVIIILFDKGNFPNVINTTDSRSNHVSFF